MEKISWVDKISNEKVLQRLNDTQDYVTHSGKTQTCGYWLGHVLRRESLLHDIIEGRMRGKGTRGRKRMHLLSNLMKGKYVALKRMAEDRKPPPPPHHNSFTALFLGPPG